MDWKARLMALPRWALPALAGTAAALVFWLRKKSQPAPVTAPVVAVQDSLPSDPLPAYYGDGSGNGQTYTGPSATDLLNPIADLFAQLNAHSQDQQAAYLAQLAALQAAEQSGFEALAGVLNARPPVTAPASPGPVSGNGGTPTAPLPVSIPPPVYVPPPPTPAPVSAPPPAPIAPPPVSAPPPVPAPTYTPGGVTSADWVALAEWIGGTGITIGGLHFAGEAIQLRWREAPWSAGSPAPPSGNYPTLILPVNYNGGHDFGRYPFGLSVSESTFARWVRWTANYMQSHPAADVRTVGDGELGRLMRDIGPYPSHQTEWYNTGFDLGNVRNSPYLSGASTTRDNPNFHDIF